MKAKQTKRGGNFTYEEDNLLVSTWLNTSVDALHGTGEKPKTLWSKITMFYNNNKSSKYPERSEHSLSNRWWIIQFAVNKFEGFMKQIESSHPASVDEQDKIEAAKLVYLDRQKSHFQYEHCWRTLRNQPKWIAYVQGSRTKFSGSCSPTPIILHENDISPSVSASPSPSPSASIDSDRPSGKEARKEKQKRGKGAENDDAPFNDIFCKWSEKKRRVLGEKIEMTEKEWHMIIKEEELEIEREKIQIQHRKEELEIMMMDLSALTGVQKRYILSLQAEILAKRKL